MGQPQAVPFFLISKMADAGLQNAVAPRDILNANFLNNAVFDEDFAAFKALEDVFTDSNFNLVLYSELRNHTANRQLVQRIALRRHLFL